MKKRIITLFIGICTAAVLTGCGGISNDKIKISEYKGLKVEKVASIKVTDENVEESINSTLQTKSTEQEITDRPVQNGDIATITYEGKLDGQAFDGGSASDYRLTIGSGQFIDGFEDGVVGHNIGETFDLNLKFPEEYQSEELAGKDVVFTVTVNKISQMIVPELTDELVAEISEKSKTVAEYKKEVKKDLEKSNKQSEEQQLEQNLWEALLKNCKVDKFPKDEKKKQMDVVKEQYGSIASMYGMDDVDEFTKQMFGFTVEEIVENTMTQQYAIELIAEKENIKVSKEDYEKGLKEYTERFGYSDTKQLEDSVGKDTMEKIMVQEKVTDFLLKNCKQVEAKDK